MPHEERGEAVEPPGDHQRALAELPEGLAHHLLRLQHAGRAIGGRLEEVRGAGGAGADGHHVDALACELEPQPLGQREVPGLGRAIGRHERGALERGERGEQHDAPAPTHAEAGGEVVRQGHRCPHVDVDGEEVVLHRLLEERPHRRAGRVVDEQAHVERGGGLGDASRSVGCAEIERQRLDLGAGAQRRLHLGQRLCPPGDQQQLEALRRELMGELRPHAFRGAGDHGPGAVFLEEGHEVSTASRPRSFPGARSHRRRSTSRHRRTASPWCNG